MKKLIALLIGASLISTAALAEDAQQAATPEKSDAVMQQLADNGSKATANGASSDQAAAPAKKAKKHCKKHGKKHHHAKKADATAPAAPAADATAPASN
ncbi:MAG TPA: hypothetical protein VLJ15_00500 [Gammaproteobacteria bacterium]|nr:hypothetical protein [Gammaproteobacteria bacterium]